MQSKFCNMAEAYSCQSVLNSKGASVLYGKTGLSSIGFIYFFGGIVAVFVAILAENSGIIHVLAVVATLALPFTLYSIFYQWRIIKTWCMLCLAIQLLLWTEFMVYFFNAAISFSFPDKSTLVILLFGFLLASALDFLTGEYYKGKDKLRSNAALLTSWERNPDVIKTLMAKTPAIEELPPFSIKMGNESGSVEILAVLGLTCIHCRAASLELQQLLDKRQDIILHIFPSTADYRMPVITDLLALTHRNKHTEAARALVAWYDLLENTPRPGGNKALLVYYQQMYLRWKAGLKLDLGNTNLEAELKPLYELQTRWFSKYDFTRVPKVFVNRKLWARPPYQLNAIF
jgi:uncharacterized membrane protein